MYALVFYLWSNMDIIFLLNYVFYVIAVLRNGDWKKMLMENYLFWSLLFCHSKLLNKSLLFAIKFNCTVQLIFQKQKVLMCYLLILEHRASWWRWLSVCFSNANGFVSSRILLLWLIVPLGGMLGFFCSLWYVMLHLLNKGRLSCFLNITDVPSVWYDFQFLFFHSIILE